MRKILYLLIVGVLLNCQPLNISSKYSNLKGDCSKNTSIKYRKIPKSPKEQKLVADKSKQTITVFLESYFSGNVLGYIGNELIFSDNVITEESLGTTEKYFIYDYSKANSLAKIKILTENDCLEINIEKKYKLVYIYFYKGKWDVVYSNIYPTYE